MDALIFNPRKILFKAWNTETKLMMRLNSIECVKGELTRKGHILLQFTGLYDKQEEEIYEMDVLLLRSERFVVVWDGLHSRWALAAPSGNGTRKDFHAAHSKEAVRLCNYYESDMAGVT